MNCNMPTYGSVWFHIHGVSCELIRESHKEKLQFSPIEHSVLNNKVCEGFFAALFVVDLRWKFNTNFIAQRFHHVRKHPPTHEIFYFGSKSDFNTLFDHQQTSVDCIILTVVLLVQLSSYCLVGQLVLNKVSVRRSPITPSSWYNFSSSSQAMFVTASMRAIGTNWSSTEKRHEHWRYFWNMRKFKTNYPHGIISSFLSRHLRR